MPGQNTCIRPLHSSSRGQILGLFINCSAMLLLPVQGQGCPCLRRTATSLFGSQAGMTRLISLNIDAGRKKEKAKFLCRIPCSKSRVITLNVMSLHTSFPTPAWEQSFVAGQFLQQTMSLPTALAEVSWPGNHREEQKLLLCPAFSFSSSSLPREKRNTAPLLRHLKSKP